MFERTLVENILRALGGEVDVAAFRERGRLWLHSKRGGFDDAELAVLRNALSKTFGLASFSPGISVDPRIDEIEAAGLALSEAPLSALIAENDEPSFRIRARRADKAFPMRSKEVEIRLATALTEKFDAENRLRVDLENADFTLGCEIRRGKAFVFLDAFPAPGGLPAGSNSPVLALLSGGIDSPVACSMLMKRGCRVDFLTFHSYPYTPERSVGKVRDLADVLNRLQKPGKLFACNLAEIQKQVRDKCTPRFRTILYRRFMFRVAEAVACANGDAALATGESVGQVASQTISNLSVINAATDMLVLRPLAGMDKGEIIETARWLGTFDISIEQVPDSCTVFAPDSPAINSTLGKILDEEAKLDVETLLGKTIADTLESPVF
jgi:thiamine biosynthesis protein ThiI